MPVPACIGLCFIIGGSGAEGQALDFLIIGLAGHITNDDHHDSGNDCNQDAEILEIDVIDNPEK